MYNIKYLLSKAFLYYLSLPSIFKSTIHNTSKVCPGSNIVQSEMDKFSYIGKHCQLLEVKVGKFCSIGDYCYIGGANHPMKWASTSPVFHCGRNILKKNFSNKEFKDERKMTEIGNDVWIGSHCLIKRGIKIGNGAVIGMGSVVTKDVKPYEIIGGNPSRFIRMRFDEDIICRIENCKWWELEDWEILQVAEHIDDVNLFIDKVNQLMSKKDFMGNSNTDSV